MNAEIENDGASSSKDGQTANAFTYPAGVGNVIMNGCWGTGYKRGDPCFNSLASATACSVSLY